MTTELFSERVAANKGSNARQNRKQNYETLFDSCPNCHRWRVGGHCRCRLYGWKKGQRARRVTRATLATLTTFNIMNKTYLIAAAVGALAGYFLASKLRNTKPFSIAYTKGVAAAGTAS